MPVEVFEFHHELPVDVASMLDKVYVDTPGTSGSVEVLQEVEKGLKNGGRYYAGQFNGKWIAGVLVSGLDGERVLRFLAVHPATRGRGVAERLVNEVRRLEAEQGEGYLVTGFDLTQPGVPEMLLALGFIPHEEGAYRCQL